MENHYQDREAIVYSEIPPRKRESSQGAQNCCIALISFIFAICFGIFTHVESKYGSAECLLTSFMTWSKAAFLYNLISFFTSIYVLPCLSSYQNKMEAKYSLIPNKSSQPQPSLPKTLLQLIRVLLALAGLIIFIGLAVTYTNDSTACGELRNLALAYIIISGIGLGISLLLLCCLGLFACLVSNIKIGERYLNNAGFQPQNNDAKS